MKSFILLFLFLLISVFTTAQKNGFWEIFNKEQVDSLLLEWNQAPNDTLRMRAARSLGWFYGERNYDSSLYFNEQQLVLARKLKLKLWEAEALDQKGWNFSQLKNYPLAMQSFLKALKIAEDEESEKNIWRISFFSVDKNPRKARLTVLSSIHNDLSRLYAAIGNREKELFNLYKALDILQISKDYTQLSVVTMNLTETYLQMKKLDSVLIFAQRALHYMDTAGFEWYRGHMLTIIGNTHAVKGDYGLAKQYFIEAIKANNAGKENSKSIPYTYTSFADLLKSSGHIDLSIIYVKNALRYYQILGDSTGVSSAYSSLFSLYQSKGNADSAFFYLQIAKILNDSLNSAEKEKINQYQNIIFEEQIKSQQTEKARIQNQQKLKTYALLFGVIVFMLIAMFLYRNNRNRRKANEILQKQKEKVESTLQVLKSTQAQLIQSEKMASLGELTAGIAHEIQNPLNFVNNFAEVNSELIVEMKEELAKGNVEEAKVISNDIDENEKKIIFHGKRADAIVKGMLQHSRSSSGVKEPTNINALADEYLRLSYHGLRAKDKSFNATMKTDFDESIGNINIIPQDIGRVILNLITNAFYAASLPPPDGGGFKNPQHKHESTVWVSTKKMGDKVLISVKDNGPGISKKILDKIFQPFFTTKPTGQGTGLGLSLSYDIVKAHGGELKVETKEGEGSEFVISLPVNT